MLPCARNHVEYFAPRVRLKPSAESATRDARGTGSGPPVGARRAPPPPPPRPSRRLGSRSGVSPRVPRPVTPRTSRPPRSTRKAFLRALADEYMARHPGVEAVPRDVGDELPAGAHSIPAAHPEQIDPVVDGRELRARERR